MLPQEDDQNQAPQNVLSSHPPSEDIIESTPEERGDIIAPEEPDVESNEAAEEGQAQDVETNEETVETEELEATEEAEVTGLGDDTEPDEPDAPKTVPLDRLNVEINKRKSLEETVAQQQARLAEMEAMQEEQEQPEEERFDFAAKLLEKNEALIQGDAEKAAELDAEILDEQRKLMANEAAQVSAATNSATRENDAFAATARELMDQYPVFDPDAPEYVEEHLAAALQLRDKFIAAGDAKPDALQQAVDLLVPKLGLKASADLQQKQPAAKKPDPNLEANVRKKSKAAESQPPKLDMGSGNAKHGEGTIPRIEELSEDEFDALPEATLARMRGDIVDA